MANPRSTDSVAAQLQSRVIVALDYPSAAPALTFVEAISPHDCRLKVGKELFTREGPLLVRRLVDEGYDVFLDLKYHDIPNTVARACEAATDLGVWMLNLHACGGSAMMEAAREALARRSGKLPLLIAVTMLTSMNDDSLREIGIGGTTDEQVLRLARLARQAGLDGVVCSGQEAAKLRQEAGERFVLVTPGVRPTNTGSNDQARVMTPEKAVAAGADYLVIGRPITQAADPVAALRQINSALASV